MKGFLEFVQEQGVVGIAVAFVLGAAVTKLVGSFVGDIINPILGIFLGKANALTDATFTVAGSKIAYGNFLSTLIDFMIVAMVVYLAYKVLKLEKLDKKKK